MRKLKQLYERVPIRYRISMMLVGFMTGTLLVASAAGFFPNEQREMLRGRAKLCETLAISGTAIPEDVELTVAGINSVHSFGAVENVLSNLSVVERFAIVEVHGDRVKFRVTAIGGMDRLRRALRFNGLIEQNDGDPIGFDPVEQVLEFFYDAGSTSRNGL